MHGRDDLRWAARANALVFGAHRINTLDKIHALTRGMRPVEEMFYSRTLGRIASSGRNVPKASVLAVYSGVSKLTRTWLRAAR